MKTWRELVTVILAAVFAAVLISSCGGGSSSGGGPAPTVTSIDLPRGGVLGGGTVDINGTGFENGAEVWFGVNASPVASFVDSTLIQAEVPAGQAGAVDVRVENPSGGSFTLAGGFEYLLAGTPTVDGDLTDWSSRYELAVNSGAGSNTLKVLSVSFDADNLYLAVEEGIPTGTGNGVLAWLDLDMGSGEGVTSLATTLSDNVGALDIFASRVKATITASGFEADAAMGSIDHAAVADTFAGDAGLRGFGTDGLSGSFSDFSWVRSTVSPGSGGLEMAVSLSEIFPGGVPVTGRTVGVFVTATASTGDFPALPDWVLPGQLVFSGNTRLVADVATFRIFPPGQY